jgi:bifunctional non-homologous end joining protein LigD
VDRYTPRSIRHCAKEIGVKPCRRDVKAYLRTSAKSPGPGVLPAFLEPSLASLRDSPPSGPKWVKYNGYRMQARIEGQDIRLLTRKNLDRTKPFCSIAAALKELRVGPRCLMGNRRQRPEWHWSFNDSAVGPQSRPPLPLSLFVFDLLPCDGFD